MSGTYTTVFASESSSQNSVPEFVVPDDVQSDGAFRHSVPFSIPEFRGLEPNIGLSYNSSFRGHGRAEVWIGTGWQLSGFSSIERVSIGGGTPTYTDARDLYRLDGEELLACSDANAANPWPTSQDYPDRYRTTATSASCSAGGTFAPMVEDYRRIEMQHVSHNGLQVPYFIVTSPSGTQYRYDSLGYLAGDTSSASHAHYNALFERKFLLSEIRDTQASANVVTFAYDFAPVLEGRAHRPDTVTYAGYEIGFHYIAQTAPLAQRMCWARRTSA